MANKKQKLKNDQFRKSRGGYSRWLLVSCGQCKEPTLVYQKDGHGILKRLYVDRIMDPKPHGRTLTCSKCKNVLGVRIIYQKEKRLAYRLFAGVVEKRILNKDRI